MVTSPAMRLGVATLALAISAALTAPARDARATDCGGPYSPCIDSDILWPHAGPARFVAIGAAETVAPGQIGFGLVATYLNQPIVFHLASPGPGGSDHNAVDNQVNGTFLWSYGVTRRLELDLAVPITLGQDGAGVSPVTGGPSLKTTAVRDMRFGFAYALVAHTPGPPQERPEHFGLVGRLEVSAPTGDFDQMAGEGSGVFVPSLAADWRSGRVSAGLELGARLRPTESLEGARVGSQLVTALGVGVDLLPRDLLMAGLEAWALPTLTEQQTVQSIDQATVFTPNGQYIVPAEWQLSARSAPLPGGELSVQLGGGGELPLTSGAITTPRFRFTLGVRWAPLVPPHRPAAAPAEGAGEPVVDLHLATDRDACRTEPDVVDGFSATTGCPDEDQDKDGIPDRFDRCPLEAEDYAGLADGCPEKPAPRP